MNPEVWDNVYSGPEGRAFEQLVDVADIRLTRDNWRQHKAVLRNVEVIISSWGGPIVDEEFLAAAPEFKLYLYGAGSIKGLMTDAAWARKIQIASACEANAVPVAEFVLSQIIFSVKCGWKYMQQAKADTPHAWLNKPVVGMYRSKIGLVSFGQIARKTCELLKSFDVDVVVSSSYATPKLEKELRIKFVSVEEIFKSCDVVSLHLPSNEKTNGLIGKELLSLLKPGATLINTARGAVINQPELIEFLKVRPDVYACIDVTDPEPPEPGCPLFTLPNVVLTPHLAGSMGQECRRLGGYMFQELERYLGGRPLQWAITRELASKIA